MLSIATESSSANHGRSHQVFFVCLTLIIVLATWLRWDHGYGRVYNYDERIAPTVMRAMIKENSLDTNWSHAEWDGLLFGRELFDTPQYNFSSYVTSSFLNSKIFAIPLTEKSQESAAIQFLRYQSMLYSVLGIIFSGLAIYHWYGALPALISALLLAVSPQLVQEAHYARPEAFVFLLSSFMLLALCCCRNRPYLLSLIAGAIAGVGIGCKFSLASLAGPYLCWIALENARQKIKNGQLIKRLFVAITTTIAAFICSSPYAFINYTDFFAGISALLRQYSKPFGNLSLVEYSYLGQLKFILSYYADSLGGVWLALAILPLLVRPKSRKLFDVYLVFFVPVLSTVAIFAISKVFFERNLAQLWPWYVLCLACGLETLCQHIENGIKNRMMLSVVGATLLLITVFKPAIFSYNMKNKLFGKTAYAGSSSFIDNLKKKHGESSVLEINIFNSNEMLKNSHMSGESVKIVALHYYNDDYCWRIERILKNQGYVETSGYRDIFSDANVSTIIDEFNLEQIRVYTKP